MPADDAGGWSASPSGPPAPRPAIAPRSTTCRTTCRSGRSSRRPANSASAASARSTRDCFVTRMRERAAEADLVIVNHHLLCADASVRQGGFGEVIPECELAVIDEAHQLEDVVTQYFGVALSTHRVDELARDAAHTLGALPPERHGAGGPRWPTRWPTFSRPARRLFDTLGSKWAARRARGRPCDRRRTIAAHADGRRSRERLNDAAARAARGPRSAAGRDSGRARRRGRPAGVAPCARIAVADDLDDAARRRRPALRALRRGARPQRPRCARRRSTSSDIVRDSVHRAAATRDRPDVGDAGRRRSFDYVTSRLGLRDADDAAVPSEFDYRTQALLYLPPDMPDPRSPEFNRAAAWTIAELLDRTQGRAFVLFTSYSAMHDVHARLEPRMSWPLLVQGTAPRIGAAARLPRDAAMPCCWPRPASGRASTSPARR